MQVSPVSSSYAATSAGDSTTTVTAPKKTLGQADFLTLLVQQLQNQDPMNPMSDTDYIAQMAQFTALQQTSAMSDKLTQLGNGQDVATASSYIGRQVTVTTDSGTAQGLVTGVQVTNGAPQLLINNSPYALSAVLRVEPAPAPSTTPVTAGASS